MHPSQLTLDRTLPSADRIRPLVADSDIDSFDGDSTIDRLHRLLYPVFRVEFTYETESGFFGTTTETATVLVDGLWEGNDQSLVTYRDSATETRRVPFESFDFGADYDGFGQTILLDFQAPDEQARALLSDRLAEVGERRESPNATVDPDTYLDQIQSAYGLPSAVDDSTFGDVTDLTRLYLPFWLVQFRSEHSDTTELLTLRVTDDGQPETASHGWLASFIASDPARLGEYGFQVQPTADDTDTQSPPTEQPVSATEAVTQPGDVDLDAESLVDPSPGRGFSDVGGMTDLKETLQKVVLSPVEQPQRFAEYGLDPVNGVLFHGPPGCGKTYTAGALAGELGHYFIEVTPADLTSRYMGEPAQRVADLFTIARANQPCVLFIDELDALAGNRSDDMQTSERQSVTQLLTELEAIDDEDIVVVGATNLIEDIDPAIRRSGRFDERIEVPPPDTDARRAILDLHLSERPTAEELTLDRAVERTAGYAASDLERIAEQTARYALEDGSAITTAHLNDAVDAVESSIDDWVGEYHVDGRSVTQPDDVDLTARSLVTPEPSRTFDDVGGMDDLLETLDRRVIDPLENPERFAEYGIDVISGLLLYGPPGCGKTYVTEALAGELGHYFIEVTPADITSKWMGEPAQNVSEMFAIARANQPCILFVDELDALAGQRSSDMNTSERQLVNQFLAELEALDDDDVVVVGATNLVEDIDPAIRRSGRFDERIEVPPPDAAARRAILEIHLDGTPTATTVNWDAVTKATAGYAASDLELLAENAARRALRTDSPVDSSHLQAAIEETHSSLDSWDDETRYADSEETSDLRYFG